MFKNFFKTKKITIPQDNAQEITELESWTVKWQCAAKYSFSVYCGDEYFKSFIKEEDAKEFEKQLNECAKFINVDIKTSIYKN